MYARLLYFKANERERKVMKKLPNRNEPVRRSEMRSSGAVRHRQVRNSQVRVRSRVRAGHEAGLRQGRSDLQLDLRARAQSLPDKVRHRARLHRCLRIQGTMPG